MTGKTHEEHEKEMGEAVRLLMAASEELALNPIGRGVALLAAGLSTLEPVIGEKGALATLKTMMGRIR